MHSQRPINEAAAPIIAVYPTSGVRTPLARHYQYYMQPLVTVIVE